MPLLRGGGLSDLEVADLKEAITVPVVVVPGHLHQVAPGLRQAQADGQGHRGPRRAAALRDCVRYEERGALALQRARAARRDADSTLPAAGIVQRLAINRLAQAEGVARLLPAH